MPSADVNAAVLDAITSLEVAGDGSVSRSELEQTAVRREAFANVAWARYQQDHPQADEPTEGELYNGIDAGLVLLAKDSILWLVGKGQLCETGEGRLRLGKPLRGYDQGTNWEQERFQSIRRVTPERKALIEASIAALGDFRDYFPVVLDEDGEIVDGRHRRAIDPGWPAMRLRVSREDRLAVAVAGNRTNAWGKNDWQRLRGLVEQRQNRQSASRVLAEVALREDANRSDREIARLTGASPQTVTAVRRDLEETAQLEQFTRSVGGRPRADGTPAQPRNNPDVQTRQAEVVRRREAGESWPAIGVATGYRDPADVFRRVTGARDREPARRQSESPEDRCTHCPEHCPVPDGHE